MPCRSKFLSSAVDAIAGAGENDLRTQFREESSCCKANAGVAARPRHDRGLALEGGQRMNCHDSSIDSGA